MKVAWIVAIALGIGDIASAQWTAQDSGAAARLRGVSVAGGGVAWASGAGGTVLKTVDGGGSWKSIPVPAAADLDFRDVQAIDAQTAFLLSIGEGERSRIYKTTNGGVSWSLQFTMSDPRGFLDAIAFWDANRGLALGDPIDGQFTVLKTSDGGRTWDRIPPAGLPPSLPGEGAFAASGTCLVTLGDGSHAWFATGGAATARVFRTADGGQTWAVAPTPIRAGNASSGGFSLAFRDPEHGIAVGGDYKSVDDPAANLATTADGGRTWTLHKRSHPSGFRSAVAYVPGTSPPALVAVGPSGADLSDDDGLTWRPIPGPGFHALGFGPTPGPGWAVGEDGRIARFDREVPESR